MTAHRGAGIEMSAAIDSLYSGKTPICHSNINSLKSSLSKISRGPIAQRLEQGTHNPLVGGSNPPGPIG